MCAHKCVLVMDCAARRLAFVCVHTGVCGKVLGFYFLLFCFYHLSHISIFMPRVDSWPTLFLLKTMYKIYVKNEYSQLVFRLSCTPESPEALRRFGRGECLFIDLSV